jgi:hypothetical protein
MFSYNHNGNTVYGTCQRVEEGGLINFYVIGFERPEHITADDKKDIKEFLFRLDFTSNMAPKGETIRVGPKYFPSLTLAPCPYARRSK